MWPHIRYVRDSFFAARSWRDIDDLNAQAQAWCEGIAAERPWPEDHSISVREAFERERGCLIALPGDRFPADERVEVTVDDADLVGLRAPVDSREVLKTFHGIPLSVSCPRAATMPPIPVLALKAQTPHWASIMARDRGTCPPQVLKAQGALGCSRSRTGFAPHGAAVALEEQDQRRLGRLVGVLPHPGALGVARTEGAGHRLAQHAGIEGAAGLQDREQGPGGGQQCGRFRREGRPGSDRRGCGGRGYGGGGRARGRGRRRMGVEHGQAPVTGVCERIHGEPGALSQGTLPL